MGAFDQIYQQGLHPVIGSPAAYGALAVKAELAYNGYSGALVLDSPNLGNAFDHETRLFQKAHSLSVDGQIGPRTAAALFRKRAVEVGQDFGVPDDIVCKLMHLESECDPGAVGVRDATDLGLVQIHMPAHPDVTVAQAFDPPFALAFAGRGLQSAHTALRDWDATVASWNVGGGGAAAWLAAGKPASLFVSWFNDPNGDPIDLGARATQYVHLVKAQAC